MSVTAEPAPPPVPGSPHDQAHEAPSTLGVGVVVWLASELMFFAGLFAAYFTLRSVNDVWPPEGVELETARTAVATVVLVASSGTCTSPWWRPARGDRRAAARWLGLTALLGAMFLTNQVLEYAAGVVPASTTTPTARSST